MARWSLLAYGLACYLIAVATLGYAIGFVGNLWVPKSMDSPALVPPGQAVLVDFAFLSLFALQHSLMLRPGFRRAWTQYLPAAAERSTFTLASSLALIVLFAGWQPIGRVVWQLRDPLACDLVYALYAAGWLLVLGGGAWARHFGLFGLRQAWEGFRQRPLQLPVRPRSHAPLPRPVALGWLLVFWATPAMTAAHVLFALAATAYLIAVHRRRRSQASHTAASPTASGYAVR